MSAENLLAELSGWKLRASCEKTLQEDIATVFEQAGIEFEREHRLDSKSIIDFKVGSVGVECKVKGSKNALLRQIIRYAEFEEIGELLVVTTRSAHRSLDGEKFLGKEVKVHWVCSFV